jgi:hypothetical protein
VFFRRVGVESFLRGNLQVQFGGRRASTQPYEYSDYNSSDEQSLTFDSYMIPEDDLELGQLRLLEVDNRVVIPTKTHLRILVTSADVLHSWAVPSLGVKCDAVPGRWLGIIPVAYCDSNLWSPGAEIPVQPGTPEPILEGVPVQFDPPAPPVVIPRLYPPLIDAVARQTALYQRYTVFNFGGNNSLAQLVEVIDAQMQIEIHIEAALVEDGFSPDSILVRSNQIRGLIHSPRGELLTQRTYASYLTQIDTRGTRASVPYRRVISAIRHFNLFLERRP